MKRPLGRVALPQFSRVVGAVVLVGLCARALVSALSGQQPRGPFPADQHTHWLAVTLSLVCVAMAVGITRLNSWERWAGILLGLWCAFFAWWPHCPPGVLAVVALAGFGASLAGQRRRGGRPVGRELSAGVPRRIWWLAVGAFCVTAALAYAWVAPVMARQAQALAQGPPFTRAAFAVALLLAGATGLAAVYRAVTRG